MKNHFFSQEEQKIVDQFLETGYVIFPLENVSTFNNIRNSVYEWGIEILQEDIFDQDLFFNNTHDVVKNENLNDFRLKLISKITKDKNMHSSIYSLAKSHIGWLVGNELAMQRSCNLVIHLANSQSSIIPLHSDVWVGNSPYEIVFWFPLVSCYKTKSMYILPRSDSEEIFRDYKKYSHLAANEFYEEIKHRLNFLDIPFGHGLIFSHSLLHGNQFNEENETRWSFDVRFKNAFSPYSSKGIGESFLPITVRPVTRIGYHYVKPELS